MAINLVRDMKFSDLSEPVKLAVSKWLPKEVKIALVDVFPPVVSQIKSVSLKQLAPRDDWLTGNDIKQAVEMYKKLANVTKITKPANPYGGIESYQRELLDAIGYNLRPNVEYFFYFEYDEGLKCIANILEKYPDYDGSCIKNMFSVPSDSLERMLQIYPELKLKLHAFNHLIQDEKLVKLIKSMDLAGHDFQHMFPTPTRFESLRKLDIACDALFLVLNIEKIRFLNPEITDLTVNLQNIDVWNVENAINFTNCVLSFEYLKSLTLWCFIEDEWNEDHVSAFYSMATKLLTADKPSLTHLDINYSIDSSNSLPIVLWNNIRSGFKYLSIQNCATKDTFNINNDMMKMGRFQPSLVDVFNKFPHVKHIKVDTKDEDYKKTLNDELEFIRSGLPRNKWLTLDFKNWN